MADKIEIFDSKQAFDDLTNLSKQLGILNSEILNISKTAQSMGVNLSKIKTPEGLQQAIDKMTATQQKAISVNERAIIAERKLATERERRINKGLAADAKQEAALAKSQTTYAKLNAALNKLKLAYRELQVKQELGQTLTMKEEIRLKSLTDKVQRLDAVLKKTDAGMGVHTRSVGNYGKAFDSLGFSVAQMTRESPAFLISMNTGFMALSNNIPIFVDEVNKLIVKNKELQAAQALGNRMNEKGVSVIGKIAGALFSWQSLISAGIVLLTVYGGKLVELAKDALKSTSALDLLAEKQEEINKTTGDSVGKFMGLISVIQDVNKSEKDRLGAMEELKSAYPDFNAKILDEENAINLVNTAIDLYITKLGKKAKAQAAMSLLQEKYTEQIDIEESARKKIAEITGEENTSLERQKEIADELQKSLLNLSKNRTKGGSQALKLREVNNLLDEQANIQEEINQLLNIYTSNIDFDAENKRKKKGNKESRERVELLKQEQKAMFGSIQYLDEQISLMEKIAKLATDDVSRLAFTEQAQIYKDMRDALVDLKDEYEGVADVLPKDDLSENQKAIDELFRESGLSAKTFSDELKKYLEDPTKNIDDFKERLEEVADAVEEMNKRMQESFEQFTETTNMFFDNRIEKLSQDRDSNEEYYDSLIDLAEGNEEEQERLEYAKEARDKELQDKQNEAAKKQAAFNKALAVANIAMNLAETISAHNKTAAILNSVSLGTLGTIYAAIEIPLSIALAAAQTAAVISAPVPKYKDGTLNATKGLAIVGDGGKHEYIEDKFGNIVQTPKTDTLVSLGGGEKIHKDLDSLISNKGYDSNDIYKATVMASLASERGISTVRLEKVLDNSLKDLKKDIKEGLQSGFKNVNFHNHTKVDLGHIKYRNNIL